MVGEIEAVGDALTGAMLGRAVEPEAGEGRGGTAANCLNCDTALMGHHCHHCGQKAKTHRTLSAFGHDILHSVLHFDGKIWRTLPLLAWNPGELTRRYVHGERAKFVSPIALFLFSVFLSFAVFNVLVPDGVELGTQTPMSAESAAKELESDRAEILRDIQELEADKKEASAENQPIGWIDGEIARHRDALNRLEQEEAPEVRKKLVAERKLAIQRRETETEIRRLEAALAKAKAAGQPTAKIEDDLEGARMTVNLMKTASDVMTKGKSDIRINLFGIEALNEAAKHATENPQLLIYKIQSNAYKYSWALIPISVPFLWFLFFWRRQFKIFDHAVFVTYSLSFMMTFAMLGAVILTMTAEGSFLFVTTILALIFLPPIHIYRQLHRGYQTTRFGALWRAFALSNFAMIALTLFSALIVALGVTS
jgi:Protein of unknown function (DUF3667)